MPTMAEVRTKFPEYNDLTDGELASALHQKFYSDMPLDEFHRAVGYQGEDAGDPVGIGGQAVGLLDSINRGANRLVGGATDAAMQGLSFGFADEIGAGFRAGHRSITNGIKGVARSVAPETAETVLGPVTPEEQQTIGQTYDRALTEQRGREKAFAADHPVLSTVGNVAGGLLGAVPVGAGAVAAAPQLLPAVGNAAAKILPQRAGAVATNVGNAGGRFAATLPGQMTTAAATGAASGAAGGFGGAEGGFENRMEGASTGAMIGGALGGALPVAGSVVNGVGGMIANVSGMRNQRNIALDYLNRAFERDKIDPTTLPQATPPRPPGLKYLSDDAAGGMYAGRRSPLAIADLGGKNVRKAARMVEVVPGPGGEKAEKFLNERQLGQQDRVTDAITDNLGSGDFHTTLEQLDRIRKEDAQPLYDEAYKKQFVWNATLETLLDRPSTRQALARAHKIAAEEGEDPSGLGLFLNEAGDVQIEKTAANMKTMDYIKRGLDDVVEQHRDPVTGKLVLDEHGRAINQTRELLKETLDTINPTYGEARKAWGGPSQTMEAMHLGRRYSRGDDEVTIHRFRELSDGDKDAFRIGMAREMIGKVQGTVDGRDAVTKVFGAPDQRRRLQALFPSTDAFKAFERTMENEARMMTTRRTVLGNSQTERIRADREDAGLLADSLMDYTQGGLRSVVMGLGRRGIEKAGAGLGEKSADALADMMYTSDRATQARIIAELRQRRLNNDEAAERAVRKIMVSNNVAANLFGQAAAPEDRRRKPQ